MKKINLLFLPLVSFILLFNTACNGKNSIRLRQSTQSDSSQYTGTTMAPEFPKNMQWVNTKHPLSLKDLRGKVVLLDFWTYGCINCYHILPGLEKLKKDFGDTLVIIGVQSAKFPSSGKVQNIHQAVLRWGIQHPVVNDKNFKIWKEYGIRAWPTLVLIDPAGKIVGKTAGEGIYKPMHHYISGVIETFAKKGKINHKPLNLAPESSKVAQSVLYFPGKVLADGKHHRLFISDTNHNRVVITNLNGKVESVIGNGKSALKDGSWAKASFNQPQGLTLIGDKLYIADTGNNAVRVVDLDKKTVSTLAGNGKQARRFNVSGSGKKIELNSPWDITHVNGKLYVAMAGSHQIWKINPENGYSQPFAGSGREGLKEGKRRSIPMAQPSGITTNGKYLYVAQPEASAVQRVGLKNDKQVKTIVGKGLFVFGDKNGSSGNVRLQHDLGIVYWNGKLLVADTYNNKIKEINPKTSYTSTFAGNGKAGSKDGIGKNAEFDQPGGLSIAGNWLYVADSDNQLIRKVNLKTRKVKTLQLSNIGKLKMAQHSGQTEQTIKLPAQTISANIDSISISVGISSKYHFNLQAPNQYTVSFGDSAKAFNGKRQESLTLTPENSFPLATSVNLGGEHPKSLLIDVDAYFCKNGGTLCRYTTYRYKVPLKYSQKGDKRLRIHQKLQIPKLSNANK
jgi:thiol-disulfide isomerase/thioredoxin